MFITKSTLLSALFVLPLCGIAYGSPAAEQALAQDSATEAQDEAQDEAQESLGPVIRSLICTYSGSVNYSAPLHLGDVGGSVSATSGTTYGSALCASRFVVEATGTAGKPHLTASATDAGSGLSQASCSKGSVSMLVFGFDGANWVQVGGDHTATGVWTPSPFGGPSSCQIGVGISVPNTYSKVRVAARATVQTYFGPVARKVTGTIFANY